MEEEEEDIAPPLLPSSAVAATMPAMRLFGRRWAMGTDDVPLLAFPVALFQLLWASALAAAVAVAARRWHTDIGGGGSGSGSSRRGAAGTCEPSVAVPYMAALGGLLSTAIVAAALALWSTWEGLKGEERKMLRLSFRR